MGDRPCNTLLRAPLTDERGRERRDDGTSRVEVRRVQVIVAHGRIGARQDKHRHPGFRQCCMHGGGNRFDRGSGHHDIIHDQHPRGPGQTGTIECEHVIEFMQMGIMSAQPLQRMGRPGFDQPCRAVRRTRSFCEGTAEVVKRGRITHLSLVAIEGPEDDIVPVQVFQDSGDQRDPAFDRTRAGFPEFIHRKGDRFLMAVPGRMIERDMVYNIDPFVLQRGS